MGRNQRDKAAFAFKSKKISMYRPTQGQAAAFALSVRSAKGETDQMKVVSRFFSILEALVVKQADWEWLEEQLIIGAADLPDYTKLITDVFSHEWAEPEADDSADGGE